MNINLSEQDYNDLMELCKELQEQENDGNAFPYFWEPMSGKYELTTDQEPENAWAYCHNQCHSDTIEEVWKDNEKLRNFFIEENELEKDVLFEDIDVDDWISLLQENDHTIFYQTLVEKSEHNPSLFKSDVKGFIQSNKHHLGKRPHTYARTIWRMPKMIKLINILTRINPVENCNEEMKLYRDRVKK